VVFVTLAVPLHLRVHGITLAWAFEGPALLYLGYVFRYRPVRIAGIAVLALATARLFLAHWPLHSGLFVPLVNKQFLAAAAVPVAAGVYAFIHAWYGHRATPLDRILMRCAANGAGIVGLIILHHELESWITLHYRFHGVRAGYVAAAACSVLWSIGACGFLYGAIRTTSRSAFVVGSLVACVGVLVAMSSYWQHRTDGYLLFLNVRFAGAVLAALAMGACAATAWRRPDLIPVSEPRPWRMAIAALFALSMLVFLSLEVYTYCWETIPNRTRARWSSQMALSIVWGAYALAALVLGFLRNFKEVRLAALGLLIIVALKAMIIDLSQVSQIYRILSFVVLGMVMICASYLYHRLEKRLPENQGG
jgi:uncharacterized membrane protein